MRKFMKAETGTPCQDEEDTRIKAESKRYNEYVQIPEPLTMNMSPPFSAQWVQ
jgi:hypothetical protein